MPRLQHPVKNFRTKLAWVVKSLAEYTMLSSTTLVMLGVTFYNNSNNRTFGSISILKFKIEAPYNNRSDN